MPGREQLVEVRHQVVPGHHRHPAVGVAPLHRLAPPVIAALARDRAGALSDAAVDRVVRTSDGLPLLVEELVDALRDDGDDAGVPRTVARVNHPYNEWMFDEVWGVDVSVSTPRLMSALVEEAVAVGDLVRLFTFRNGDTNVVEFTLPEQSTCVGMRIGELGLPGETVLVAVIRDGRASAPDPDGSLEAGDELLFVTSPDHEQELADVLSPRGTSGRVVSGKMPQMPGTFSNS